jgi:hypothetical protein
MILSAIPGNYVLKISDMGLSKQLEKDDDSFTSMSFSFPAQAPDQSLHSHSLQSTTSEGTRDVNEDSTSNGRHSKLLTAHNIIKELRRQESEE